MSVKSSFQVLARRLLLASANKRGYELRKAPFAGFQALPVFDLAVQFLMLKRGAALRFIQVGANDGILGDPLRKYILRCGWRGVLVEPQPETCETLRANYTGHHDRLVFENVAVSAAGPSVSLYRVKQASQFQSSVASLDPAVAARQLGVHADALERISVPTATLDGLVAKHGLQPLDLLQIDTEGHEWQVLQTLDLTRTRPALIQFETGHLAPQVIGTVVRHLNAQGYVVYYGGHQADSLAMESSLLDAMQ